MRKKYKVNIGDKYNKLTVIDIITEGKKTIYKCLCDCGNEYTMTQAAHLVNGINKTCGCRTGNSPKIKPHKEFKSKGKRRLQDIWRQMHNRCEKPDHISYKYYGAKGIQVSDEWNAFQPFYEWALTNGYTDKLTLDRIDSAKNYGPDNCRWADRNVQNNNSSHCHYLTFNGKTMSMSNWSKETGIPYNAIKSRLNKLHWTVEEALTVQYNQKIKNYR